MLQKAASKLRPTDLSAGNHLVILQTVDGLPYLGLYLLGYILAVINTYLL